MNTSKVLERCFNISSKEKSRKMKGMLKYVMKHSTKSWANQFLRDIKQAHHQLESTLFLGLTSDAVKHRLINKNNIKQLSMKSVLDAYSETSNRLIIIDVKGIVSKKDQGDIVSHEFSSSELSDKMVHLLDVLSRFEENKFWIISPDVKSKIEEMLKKIERYKGSNTHNTGISSNL